PFSAAMAIPRRRVVSPRAWRIQDTRLVMDERLATYLKTRRTIPASMLGEPGPDPASLNDMLTIAARVPDHGKLAPWRFILFDRAAREKAVAGLVRVAERHPDERERQVRSAKAKGFADAPLVVGVISAPIV